MHTLLSLYLSNTVDSNSDGFRNRSGGGENTDYYRESKAGLPALYPCSYTGSQLLRFLNRRDPPVLDF